MHAWLYVSGFCYVISYRGNCGMRAQPSEEYFYQIYLPIQTLIKERAPASVIKFIIQNYGHAKQFSMPTRGDTL